MVCDAGLMLWSLGDLGQWCERHIFEWFLRTISRKLRENEQDAKYVVQSFKQRANPDSDRK